MCRVRVFLHGPLEVWKREPDNTWKQVEREVWGRGRLSRGKLQEDIWPDPDFELASKYVYNAISTIHRVAGQDLIWTDIDACETLLRRLKTWAGPRWYSFTDCQYDIVLSFVASKSISSSVLFLHASSVS